MNTFSQNLAEKTTTELQGVLSNFNQLTVASKKELYSFLRDREGFDREKLDALQKDIESHDSEVENLKYLRNIGFAIEEDEDSIQIKRTKSAKWYDLSGAFIGLILLFNFIPFYVSLMKIFEEGGDIMSYVVITIFFTLASLGFILFYKSLNRYLEFFRFKIVKNSSGLIIKKQGISSVESILSNNLLMYKRDDKKAFIYLKDDEAKPIITSKTNPLFHDTLKELHSKLI